MWDWVLDVGCLMGRGIWGEDSGEGDDDGIVGRDGDGMVVG